MLNEALKLIRLFYEMTQKDLADQLDISVSYLSEIESGNRRINIDLINKYSEVFDIPASSLLLFSEGMESKRSIKKIKKFMTKKMIRIMDWVAKKGDLENAIEKKTR